MTAFWCCLAAQYMLRMSVTIRVKKRATSVVSEDILILVIMILLMKG